MALHWREDEYGDAERRAQLSAWRPRFMRRWLTIFLPSWLLVEAVWVLWRGWPRSPMEEFLSNVCGLLPALVLLGLVDSRWARQHPDEAAALGRGRARL